MRTACVALIVVSLAGGAAAQAPKAPAAAPRVKPESYTYDSGGRRDPFLNLLGAGEPRLATGNRGAGAAGLTVGEISVRGVMQSRDGLVAMVQGPDNKTYLVHQGDKFVDGTVKAVTAQGLVIVQEVNDPLSLVKQREIRKQLRSTEGAK